MHTSLFRKTAILLGFTLVGLALLTCFSFIQKMISGFNPYILKGYAVPVLFGGAAGLLVGGLVLKKRETNRQLAYKEKLLSKLFQDIDAGVFILDRNTHVIEHVNRYALDLLGAEAEEIVGNACHSLFRCHEGDGRTAPVIEPPIAKKECSLLSKDGRSIPIIRSLKSFSIDGQDKILETIIDIEAQKQAEAKLADEAEQRKILQDKSYDGIVIIDQEHRIVEANDKFADMLGYPPHEIVGLYTWDYVDEYDEEEIRQNFSDLTKIKTVFESRHRRKDGRVIDVEVSVSGVRVGGHRLAFAICRDIGERKRMESALLEATNAAETASKAKSEFLANMSHEIRTPINGIMGMLQLIDSTELTDEQKKYVAYAFDSSKRLTRLLSDILDLSRVEAGKMELRPEPFDLSDTLDAILQLFEPVAREKGIGLHITQDSGGSSHLCGDMVRLQQILSNLVGNAIKFTDRGHVSIKAQVLRLNSRGEHPVLFTISDTGVGISDDNLSRLFSSFTQADGSYNRRFQGAGLGLAISKRLVELMGGSLSVESEVGLGTAFHACIPFSPSHDAPSPPEKRLSAGSLTDLRILVAEDDRTSQLAVTRLLEKSGCRTVTAGDGRQALDALRENDFDVVLMDVQMPVLDGMETTRAIRNGEAGEDRKAVPIIAMTAHSMAGDREKFLDAGMDDYVSKPVEIADLLVKLGELLDNSGRT